MFRRNRHRPPTNPETITLVPDTHITPERRATLFLRATDGEDVYCYGSVDSPTGIINLWDTDTRIPLFPLAQWKWELMSCLPIMKEASPTYYWRLTFKDRTAGTQMLKDITVHIDRRPNEALETYGERAKRIAQEIEGNLANYGQQPIQYSGTNW
jgi:hypothetical protein